MLVSSMIMYLTRILFPGLPLLHFLIASSLLYRYHIRDHKQEVKWGHGVSIHLHRSKTTWNPDVCIHYPHTHCSSQCLGLCREKEGVQQGVVDLTGDSKRSLKSLLTYIHIRVCCGSCYTCTRTCSSKHNDSSNSFIQTRWDQGMFR